MNELPSIILSLSLSGALLTLVLLLCKPLVKNKLSKGWQYYIWLIVVARLLLPFTPEASLMGTLFQHFDSTNAVTQPDESLQWQQGNPKLPETDSTDGAKQSGTAGGEYAEHEGQLPSSFHAAMQNIGAIGLLIWFMVAVGLMIRKVTAYQSFVKYIKAGRLEVSDMALWEQVGGLMEQTGIKGAVGLYTNSLISSPLLVGFLRPCIMLPTTELSDSDFQFTILHELTHCKRRDMFYKWLVQFTVCLHWFNPLVYLMSREVGRMCELSCDEAVIGTLDPKGRRAYGDTLLNAVGAGGSYKDSLASVTLREGKERLKERLDAIMHFKRKTRVTAAISIALTVMLCFGATAAGAYAGTTQGREKAANPPVVEGAAPPLPYANDAWDEAWDDAWDDFDAAFSDDAWDSFGADFFKNEIDFSSDMSIAKLVNTRQWNVDGVVEIEVAYGTDGVKLLQGSTKEIVLKEYMSQDSTAYHAITSVVDSKLNIERGERPASSPNGYISYIELYVPADFNGLVKLGTETGSIYVTDYNGNMECFTHTGMITVSDSNICGSLKSDTGMIAFDLDTVLGNLDVHSLTGGITANISKSASFELQAQTKTGVVINHFSDSLTASRGLRTGKWGSPATNKISLSTDTGSIRIAEKAVSPQGKEKASSIISLSSNGQGSLTQSGSFASKEKQELILTVKSSIQGGAVDFFLFSPDGKERRFTFTGQDRTETIALSAGRWAYNCTGFFSSGEIAIAGEIKN